MPSFVQAIRVRLCAVRYRHICFWGMAVKLRTGNRVYVCDGGRYVTYENRGDTDVLDLRVADKAAFDNPPAREQGADRPGRYPSPDGQRSAVGQTDPHDLAETRFITSLADKIDAWSQAAPGNRFVLIADPRSMGVMRQRLSRETMERMLGSVTGDFVHRPVSEISRIVDDA